MAYPKRLFLGLGLSIANGWPNNQGGGTLPVFTLQPQSQTVDEYATATFSCEVTGGVAPYSYQWKKNGINAGTNSAELSFTAAAADNNASITVVVTDSMGAVITSNVATLGVTGYRYLFDGVSQKALLSSTIIIDTYVDFSLDFYFRVQTGEQGRPFGNSTNLQSRVYIDPSGSFVLKSLTTDVLAGSSGTYTSSYGSRVKINISRVGEVLQLRINDILRINQPYGGNHAFEINQLLAHSNIYGVGSIDNFKAIVGGVELINLPMNNKSQGANQMTTSGGINATIINYNPAGWVAI